LKKLPEKVRKASAFLLCHFRLVFELYSLLYSALGVFGPKMKSLC